jgi:hypothetical protein
VRSRRGERRGEIIFEKSEDADFSIPPQAGLTACGGKKQGRGAGGAGYFLKIGSAPILRNQ